MRRRRAGRVRDFTGAMPECDGRDAECFDKRRCLDVPRRAACTGSVAERRRQPRRIPSSSFARRSAASPRRRRQRGRRGLCASPSHEADATSNLVQEEVTEASDLFDTAPRTKTASGKRSDRQAPAGPARRAGGIPSWVGRATGLGRAGKVLVLGAGDRNQAEQADGVCDDDGCRVDSEAADLAAGAEDHADDVDAG